MPNNLNPQLLVDLAKCVNKYSPEDFRAVSEALADTRLRAEITKMLEELACVSRRIKSKKPTKPPKIRAISPDEAANWGRIIMKGKSVT